ncbi:MAG: hypothetical protein Q7J07_08905 [Pelolinea sp.]|nr:hypothetical protein [Pelolinea sp.]
MEDKKTNKTTSIPQETITWLLNSRTPSIRYLTLTSLLHKPADDVEVQAVRTEIPTSKPVSAIFSRQDPEGFWVNSRHYYSPKYRSSHWTMLLLTELAVPPETPALQRGADFMRETLVKDKRLDYHQEKSPGFYCLWGNWLRYQLYCGRFEDAAVQKVIEMVCRDIHRSGACRYNGDLPCSWAVIRELNGLALIPKNQRSPEVEGAIRRGIEFVVEEHDLVAADYPVIEKIHPLWFSLSFPLFYHTDILFTLRVLKELDALDHPNAVSALKWLKDKQTKKGIWTGGSPFKSRTRPFLAEPDTPNHWITLLAATVFS